jgi:hypothetical protein
MDNVDEETLNNGFTLQGLVAVQESQNFWLKHGFKLVKKIEKYGEEPAIYMKRRIMCGARVT